ncbi:MAG: hypothetical protein Q7S31_00660 [bacterium]|nr:hypothetical protein [bacterium]
MLRGTRLFWGGIMIALVWLVLRVPLNLKNDLDGNLVQPLAIRQGITDGAFTYWNFSLHQGLPTLADPINLFWHPVMPILLLLPTSWAVYVIETGGILATVMMGYFLFRHLTLSRQLSLGMAVTYAASGFYFSRVVIGHLEKVVSYPLIPLYFLTVLRLIKHPDLKRAGIVGLTLWLLLASTDTYTWLYILQVHLILGVYLLFRQRQSILAYLASWGLFIGISAVRWQPILSILPNLFKIPDPYSGSQNLFSMAYHLFFPLKQAVGAIGMSGYIPTNFAWWEKSAFIGPLFLVVVLVCVMYKQLIKFPGAVLAVLAILVSLAMASPASIFSPWHWVLSLFPQAALFHVPTRVFSLLSLAVLMLSGLIIELRLKKYGGWLVGANCLLVLALGIYVVKFRLQPPVLSGYASILSSVINSEAAPSVWYPAFDYPLQEREQINRSRMFFTTHGTYLKNSAAADWSAHFQQGKKYTGITPQYLVLPNNQPLPFAATAVATSSGVTVYQTTQPTGLSSLGWAHLETNRIIIDLPVAETARELVVYQSYFPGWKVEQNSSVSPAGNKDGYLVTQIQPQVTQVKFTYRPQNYEWAALMSLATLLAWVIWVFRPQPRLLYILLVAAALRVVHLGPWSQFGDMDWFFVSARQALSTGHLPILGITASITWLHQGPLWTYLLLLPTAFHLPPQALTIAAGITTVALVYLAAGWLPALLLAVLPFSIISDQTAYHTTLIPLFFFVTYFCLIRHKPFRAGLFIGFLYQSHLLTFIYWPLWVYLAVKHKLSWPMLTGGLIVGILPFILAGPLQFGGIFVWLVKGLLTGFEVSSGVSTAYWRVLLPGGVIIFGAVLKWAYAHWRCFNSK